MQQHLSAISIISPSLCRPHCVSQTGPFATRRFASDQLCLKI